MKLVSPLLKHLVYPVLSKSGHLRRTAQPGPVVVTYHGIFPAGYKQLSENLDGHLVTLDVFRRHMRLLKSKYNLISPLEFLGWLQGQAKCPPGSVLLTCDDGLLNVLTEMLPVIVEMELRFLLFVTGASASESAPMLWYEKLYLWLQQGTRSARVELPGTREYLLTAPYDPNAHWRPLIRTLSQFEADQREQLLCKIRTQLGISENWDSEYSQNESLRRRFFVVNAAQLQELKAAGMTIGAHALSHPMLSQMPEELAYGEMVESRNRLEGVTGEKPWALAYPFGDREAVSEREPDLARRAEFQCAFINTEAEMADTHFAFPRIHVSSRTSVAELEAHVSGFYRSMRRCSKKL